MSFGEVLKGLREEKGVTQKEVARACGFTPTCICQLESGTRNPTGSTIRELANYFDCSADFLLELENDLGVKTYSPTVLTLNKEELRKFTMRLKELRHEKNLTQRELAQILSITIPTLSHWECGYQEPSNKDLLAISDTFNVSVDYLLGRTDELGAIIPPPSPTVPALADDAKHLLEMFERMDHQQKIQAVAYCEGLLSTSGNTSRYRRG